MGKLKVLSKRGDDETLWDDETSAAEAEKIFNDLLKAGHAAFTKDGKITKFDPTAEEIIVTRPLVGG